MANRLRLNNPNEVAIFTGKKIAIHGAECSVVKKYAERFRRGKTSSPIITFRMFGEDGNAQIEDALERGYTVTREECAPFKAAKPKARKPAKPKARKPAKPKARKPAKPKARKPAKRKPRKPPQPPQPPPQPPPDEPFDDEPARPEPLAVSLSIVITGARAAGRLANGIQAISAMKEAVEGMGAITSISAWNIEAAFYNPMFPSEVMRQLTDNSELFALAADDNTRLAIGVVLADGRFQILAHQQSKTLEEAFFEYQMNIEDYEPYGETPN